jgi:DNA-binding response OmpR family regulator
MSGIEVCEKIRESGKNIPILILTARGNIKDKVSGFES